MNTIDKAPYEFFPIYLNFSVELIGGETIISYTLSCTNTKNLLNTILDIVDSSEISGVKIKVMVKNGAIGDQHKITAKISTSTGNIYEKEVLLVIIYDDSSEFEKQPREQFLILNDFKNELGTGETLWTKAVTATRIDDEADFTGSIITQSSFSGTRVIVGVQAGNDEERYRIAIQVVTNGGNKFQKNVVMVVNEL